MLGNGRKVRPTFFSQREESRFFEKLFIDFLGPKELILYLAQ